MKKAYLYKPHPTLPLTPHHTTPHHSHNTTLKTQSLEKIKIGGPIYPNPPTDIDSYEILSGHFTKTETDSLVFFVPKALIRALQWSQWRQYFWPKIWGEKLVVLDIVVAPPDCIISTSCITPNVNDWWSPLSLVLCTNPKFPTSISQTWKRTTLTKIKIRLPMLFCLIVPIPKRYDPCSKTPGGDLFGRNPSFWGTSLTWGPRGPSHPPKNYLQGDKSAMKIWLAKIYCTW